MATNTTETTKSITTGLNNAPGAKLKRETQTCVFDINMDAYMSKTYIFATTSGRWIYAHRLQKHNSLTLRSAAALASSIA